MTGSRSVSWEWKCRIQEKPPLKKHFAAEDIIDHPLKSVLIAMSDSRAGGRRGGGSTGSSTPTPSVTGDSVASAPSTIMDPLGVALDGSDPLSIMAADSWDIVERPKGKVVVADSHLEPWSVKRISILNKFTTSERLSMVSSYLPGGEKVAVKAHSSVTRTRLEQLDDFEDGSAREVGDLTQQEYVTRIEQLNRELVQAWQGDQRVKALKIAIQCSKLLVDTAVIQFYPSKFVLITDILDIFGQLVYHRLRTKAEYVVPGSNNTSCLPENFTPDMVPESAKETCRNWFYKIASIRELVPRLYVEAAILKSYSFLTSGEFSQALARLTRMTRGIGNPLVAVYARCYLCRVATTVTTSNTNHLRENFFDFLSAYRQLFICPIWAEISGQKVEMATYLMLYIPALEWILQGLAQNADEMLFNDIFAQVKLQSDSGLLLNTIMTTFKPTYVASRAELFIELIIGCQKEDFPEYLLYKSLGECMRASEPPSPSTVLSAVWPLVARLSSPSQYVACAQVWVHFIVKHFTSSEVNAFLGDVISHMSPQRVYEQFYPQLQTILDAILTNTTDFESLFTMDKLLPLLDLFRSETIKLSVCKSVMTVYTARSPSNASNDPVVIDALMFVCKLMHDAVNSLTVEDEKRQIGLLISEFVQRVEFGRDFEKQLSFYVDARAAFFNLDSVHAILVQCVNRLSVETCRIMRGHHTRKTASFVRACAAYCYITVPSIASETTRLQLYLLSAQVALMSHCLGQADACLKAALSLVPELPLSLEVEGKMRSTEPFLVSYLSNFLSTLLVVPDSPEQGVLYLTRGLISVLQHYTLEANSSARAQIYLNAIDLLSVSAQQDYPYHVKKVDSNDVLYGSDSKFIADINSMCSVLIEEILSHLKLLGSNQQLHKQASVAFDLFVRVALRGDLTSPGLATLALNLWNLSRKNGLMDAKVAMRTTEYLKRWSSQLSLGNIYTELLCKLEY